MNYAIKSSDSQNTLPLTVTSFITINSWWSDCLPSYESDSSYPETVCHAPEVCHTLGPEDITNPSSTSTTIRRRQRQELITAQASDGDQTSPAGTDMESDIAHGALHCLLAAYFYLYLLLFIYRLSNQDRDWPGLGSRGGRSASVPGWQRFPLCRASEVEPSGSPMEPNPLVELEESHAHFKEFGTRTSPPFQDAFVC